MKKVYMPLLVFKILDGCTSGILRVSAADGNTCNSCYKYSQCQYLTNYDKFRHLILYHAEFVWGFTTSQQY